METLIFISCVYIFAYNSCEIARNFQGSSAGIKLWTGLTGNICHIASYALFIWSFWHYDWWQPIIAYIASIFIGGLSGIFFQRNIIGMMLSPVLAIVFTVLSVINLLNS